MLYEDLRARRKHARLIGVSLSVTLLLLAAFVFIIVKSLPSLTELRSSYFSSRLRKPVLEKTLDTVSASTQPPSAPPTRTAAVAPSPTPAAISAPSSRTLADYATERFVDRGDRSLAVCSSLSGSTGSGPFDFATMNARMTSQINSGQVDPFAEALIAPLGAILQMPNVAAVVTQLRDAQESGDTGLLRQTQFYSAVAFAASDVYSNRAMIDRVSDHAYHLSVIARIAATIPGAGNDMTLQSLCTAVEARVLAPMSATNEDETAERAALLQLIGAMGLTPQQAGFDANLSTRLSVTVTPTQLTLSSPWMTQMYQSNLQLSVAR